MKKYISPIIEIEPYFSCDLMTSSYEVVKETTKSNDPYQADKF